jgi:replicative DNA helicase
MKKINYEIQLLGRMVADKNNYFQNSNLIHEGLFLKHAEFYRHIVKMFQKDMIPAMDNLLQSFPEHTDVILDIISVDYSIPMQLILQELHEQYRNYTISNGCARAESEKTSEEKIRVLTETLMQVEKTETKQVIFHASDVARELIRDLQTGINPGLLTDFTDFDSHTGGLQPSDLVVIAARASQGKTSLALTISNNLLAKAKKVFFISMEMSKPQLILRILSADLRIPAKLARQKINEFTHAASMLDSRDLYLADVNNTDYQNVIGLIRSAFLKYNIHVAIIDYLQLMRSREKQNREQEIGTIARAFKNLAKELNIPILLLSQLSRPDGRDYEPKLSSLRDSGQIEEAADIVWLIYRPEFYDIYEYTYWKNGQQYSVGTTNRAFHNIAKGRNYGTTEFETGFEKTLARFCDTRHTCEHANDPVLTASDGTNPF